MVWSDVNFEKCPKFFMDVLLGGRGGKWEFNKGTLKKGKEHKSNVFLPVSLHFHKSPRPIEKGSLSLTYMISYQRLTSMKCVIILKWVQSEGI